jgi:hypothetical protein
MDVFRMHGMAFTAPRTCIGRVDKDNAVSFSICLISAEIPELPEIPFMYGFVPFCFSVSDVGEVFHRKNFSRFEFFHNAFADDMVYICLKPLLTPRHLLEMSFGGFCAFGLEAFAKPLISFQHRHHSVVVELFIRGDCYRIYSDINTDNSVATKKISVDVFRDHDMQKHSLFIVIDKVCTIDFPFSILFVAVWDNNWYFDAAFDGAERDNIIFDAETASIITNRKIFFKGGLKTMFKKNRFKGFAGFVPAAAHELCRKVKHTANSLVCGVMQHSFVADMLSKTDVCNNLCRFGILFHRFKKDRFCRYLDFHRGNRFHTKRNAWGGIYSFIQFLHPLKWVVSLEENL